MSHKDMPVPTVAADFDNGAVANAVNPHRTPQQQFGYFHGPIPNHNAGWVPPAVQAQLDSGVRKPKTYSGMDANAPEAGEVLSPFNTFVCDVVVDGNDNNNNTMCGWTGTAQRDLRRHLRERHPGAIINPGAGRGRLSDEEKEAGLNALKHWVLCGGWRDARYAKEPAVDGRFFVKWLADAAEAIAAADAGFAARFGTVFNRPAAAAGGGVLVPGEEAQRDGRRQAVIWCPACGVSLAGARGHRALDALPRGECPGGGLCRGERR